VMASVGDVPRATPPVDQSQRTAARVVGFVYLFAMATAVFTEVVARKQLIVPGNALETARNIVAHERLFRLGIASYLLCMASDVAMIAALYVILQRVNRGLALFAAGMRMVETAIGVVATLTSLDVLQRVGGADSPKTFSADQIAALASVPLGVYGWEINVTFVFLGIGSAVFGYLWLKSRYIPRALAALGIFGSALIAAGALAMIVYPALTKVLLPTYFAPIAIFEVTMGFLLLFREIPIGQGTAT
jgi:hypothetical protein